MMIADVIALAALAPGALGVLLAVVYTIAWWRNRRKGRGRKALKELGAKSRARVRSLVRRMTPSPIPSPAGARS